MKKQVITQLTIVATLMAMLFCSCKKEDITPPVELKVSKQSLEFKADDTEQVMEVTSNFDWEAKSDADWCKVKVEKTALTVYAEAYTDTEMDRYATITIKSSNGRETKTKTVDIVQTKQEAAALVLNPGKAIIECEGLVPTSIEFIATVGHVSFAWEGGEKPEWMNDPVIDGNTITLTAQDNPTKQKRTTTLTVTVGKEGNQASETLEIEQTQNAPYIKIIPEKELVLDYSGTPATIDVYWNTENIDMKELLEGSWGYRPYQIEEITEQPTGLRGELLKRRKRSFKIWMELNPETTERSVTFGIYSKSDPGKADEISVYHRYKIRQEATPKASFNVVQKSFIFASKGGEETVEINASINNWTATSEASWLELKKDENGKLVMKASANTTSENKKAVVKLSCGTPSNNASAEILVTIAGTNTKLALSTNQINLDSEGTEQSLKVLSESKDWFVEGQPEWLTINTDTANGTISIKATKADATREATLKVISTAGGSKVEAELKVRQSKKYQVGEIYTIDGKAVGIVYYVYNNGSNGYVFSFEDNRMGEQNYDVSKIPCWSIGMYAGNREEAEDPILRDMQPCCLDQNDGRNNLEAVKKRNPADLRGKTWQERYPSMAWVDKFNEEHNNQGWYIPSKNELKTLVLYLNGIYEGSDVVLPDGSYEDPENSKKRAAALEEVNKIITANNGSIFYRDLGIDGCTLSGMTTIISSTEADARNSGLGYVGVYLLKTIYPWWDQWHHASAVDEYQINDLYLPIRSSIRPILRF